MIYSLLSGDDEDDQDNNDREELRKGPKSTLRFRSSLRVMFARNLLLVSKEVAVKTSATARLRVVATTTTIAAAKKATIMVPAATGMR